MGVGMCIERGGEERQRAFFYLDIWTSSQKDHAGGSGPMSSERALGFLLFSFSGEQVVYKGENLVAFSENL